MTQDRIIELAREAGFHKWYTQPDEHPEHVAIVARFAALVRAAALEEAVKERKAELEGGASQACLLPSAREKQTIRIAWLS